MGGIIRIGAAWREGRLEPTGLSWPDLRSRVMSGWPVVLGEIFPPAMLTALRDTIHAWGASEPITPAQTYIDENFHTIEAGISPRQKTVHNYHAYNFNHPTRLPEPLGSALMAVVAPMRDFQNRLTGQEAGYERDVWGHKLHPQVIHYPSGAGVFGQHTHPLEPQRIGLILGLAKRGRDFGRGGTFYAVDGQQVNGDAVHDLGDLMLFRFDLPHGVSAVDPEETLDYASARGRWTFVLPYY